MVGNTSMQIVSSGKHGNRFGISLTGLVSVD